MSKRGCTCKSASQISPTCTHCPKGKAPPSSGGQKGQKNKQGYGDGKNAYGNQSGFKETSMDLLKAAAVFIAGCILTVNLAAVANELG